MAIDALAARTRKRLPLRVASQLPRLARRAHAFHRFAHHPLCDRYQGELLALRGRTRVCRGCCYAAAGAVTGLALGTSLALPVWPLLLLSAAASAWYTRAKAQVARANKFWTRAVPLLLMAAALGSALREVNLGAAARPFAAWQLFGALLCSLALLGIARARYRVRGPYRAPCESCPERTGSQPCSGFRTIVRAERAFVRRAQQLIDREQRARTALTASPSTEAP